MTHYTRRTAHASKQTATGDTLLSDTEWQSAAGHSDTEDLLPQEEDTQQLPQTFGVSTETLTMEGLAQQVALLQAQLAAAFQMGALMAPQQPAAPTPAASTGQHPAAAGRPNVSGDTHAQMVAKLRSVPKLDTTRQSPQRNILTWLTAMQYELELHQIPTACWVLCALDFLDQAARDYYVQAYSATELREPPWVKFATQLKSQHMPLGLRAQASHLQTTGSEPTFPQRATY